VKVSRVGLAGKFTAITGLVLVCTIALFAFISIEALTGIFHREAQGDAETLSEIILHTAHTQMLQGHLENVYRIMDDVSTHEKITRIRLFNKDGTVRYSTHRNEIGKLLNSAVNEAECRQCHCTALGETFPPMTASTRVVRDCRGEESLSVTTPISNQPVCSAASCHVHTPETPTLGFLEIEASLRGVGLQTSAYRKNILAFAMALLLILVACLVWLTQQLVVQPVNSLLLHITDVASMQFDGRVELKSKDEMGELSNAFNLLTVRLRKVQQEYSQLTETLERRIEERTSEIARMHAQLLHAEKLASLGELVAGIAHEINNPLSGILMFATLLANNRLLPADVRSDAQTIVFEARRCAGIVKRLLEFSKKSIPNKELVSPAEIMNNSLAMVEHQAALVNIEIVRNYQEGLPEILVDPNQVEQVFVNMFVNSCQAMPQGGRLTISMQSDCRDNLLRATIADTGHGISPQNLPKIFDPFFTTKDQPVNGLSGTGLGLSVSYGIIENHGGRITVESELDRGTTFTVDLPLLCSEPRFGSNQLPTTHAVG